MRVGAVVTLLVMTAVIPVASTAELQVSADTGVTPTAPAAAVDPSAGAGIDVGTSGTASATESTSVTTAVPPEYYSLASDLTQSLCDALYNGLAAAIDYFRGQAYHEPVRPVDLVLAVSLCSVKVVLEKKLHEDSFQKPLKDLHLALIQLIGPNVQAIQLLSVAMAELQDSLKDALKDVHPISTLYEILDDAMKNANNDREKSAYDTAKKELDDMVTDLAKYISDVFYMFLSKAFPSVLLS
ncbi:hypothetical protein [Methanopyrus sp.]